MDTLEVIVADAFRAGVSIQFRPVELFNGTEIIEIRVGKRDSAEAHGMVVPSEAVNHMPLVTANAIREFQAWETRHREGKGTTTPG